MVDSILHSYWFAKQPFSVQPFGSGLINHTWKVLAGEKEYILQRINQAVFPCPENIAYNIGLVGAALKAEHPNYLFVAPTAAIDGSEMIHDQKEGYFRMFPFVAGSYTVDVVANAHQAYEAAIQFGRFTKYLQHVDGHQLKVTIPSFHDLALRYQQFLYAVENGNRQRILQARTIIDQLLSQVAIVEKYSEILAHPGFKIRIMHHDTKISNVLFSKPCNGLCVIDLDTIMPGYFISDVGDMMRTYLSPVSEEEIDLDRISIRDDVYKAIVDGYSKEMADELTVLEKAHFFYAGQFMIYMQAIRFLTDFLNNDIYYGEKYKGHNLMRAKNQAILLQRLTEKETLLKHYGGVAMFQHDPHS